MLRMQGQWRTIPLLRYRCSAWQSFVFCPELGIATVRDYSLQQVIWQSPAWQVFVEQMFSGVRLILSLDGIGLDVEAKLDQAWETLTLVFNGVEKTIRMDGVRHVSVYQNPGPLRRLEQLEASDSAPFWAVRTSAQAIPCSQRA